MAQFVTFTDVDGLVTRINPVDVVALFPQPSNPAITVVRLNDNSTFLSTLAIPVLQSLFSVNDVVAIDIASLAALESITVQNPGGVSAVNIQDGGNSITVDAVAFDTRPLNCATDSVTICPGVNPIQVVFAGTCGDIGISPVPVCFALDFASDKVDVSGSAVSITGTVITDDLTFANDKVDVSGSAITVTIEALTFAEDKVDVSGSAVSVTQTTSPWVTSLDATTLAALESITVQNPSGAGAVNIQDGGNSITVDGSVSIVGSVAVTQSTSPWVTSLDAASLAALESITVQNPSGAGAVNIQDGGNSITVDGSVSIVGSVAVTGPLTDTQLRATAIPVSGPLTDTQIRATPLPISGTVTVTDGSGPLTVDGTVAISGTVAVTQSTSPWVVSNTVLSVVGGGTEAAAQRVTIANNSTGVLAVTDNGGSLTVDGSVSITGSVAVTGPLTDAQLRASSVPVSGAFFQATQPVSGPLTDVQLRATPVPISGTVTVTDGSGPLTVDGTVAATQSGSWSVTNLNGAGAAAVNIQDGGNSITVDGTVSISGSVAVTGPLTDTQLRATPIPVSGTVAVTQSTSPWVVSQQSGTITNGAETAVSSTAVQILASNANRKKYLIQNTGAANIRVGTTGVTATTGARVVPNGTLLFEMPNCPTQGIFAIREGSVDSIAFAEEIV